MRAPSAPELLSVWEQGFGQPSMQQALLLLTAACPDTPADTLTSLSIGQRDAMLLTLRELLFGSRLVGVTSCPSCGGQVEFTLHIPDVQVVCGGSPPERLSLKVGEYDLEFRLPSSQDLIAVGDDHDVATARKSLLERCILAASRRGEETSAHELPEDIVDAVAERMAESDRQSDVSLALSCPQCGHQWPAVFDIVSFFWSEISGWAQRTLRDVHTLASMYGWSEVDILAMSPSRRQYYLNLVGA